MLAIAKYEDRFVIPTSHKEAYMDAYNEQGTSGFDACNGCSLAGNGVGANNSPAVNTANQSSYEKNFYGGIWRD